MQYSHWMEGCPTLILFVCTGRKNGEPSSWVCDERILTSRKYRPACVTFNCNTNTYLANITFSIQLVSPIVWPSQTADCLLSDIMVGAYLLEAVGSNQAAVCSLWPLASKQTCHWIFWWCSWQAIETAGMCACTCSCPWTLPQFAKPSCFHVLKLDLCSQFPMANTSS